MDGALENLFSVFSFGIDLVVNQPALVLPVPALVVAALGLAIVFFAAASDILGNFSGFRLAASIVISSCLAIIGYMSYLKNPAPVFALCILFCFMIRVFEAVVVGRALASRQGILLLGIGIVLTVIFVISRTHSWLRAQKYLLVVWNAAHAYMAATLAASILTQYSYLRHKDLLRVGFGFMFVAASITVPQDSVLNLLYLWLYAVILVLSFAMSWSAKMRAGHFQ